MQAAQLKEELHLMINKADDRMLSMVYAMMNAGMEEESLDLVIKQKLTERALRSEKDIQEGKVYTIEDAKNYAVMEAGRARVEVEA